MSLPSTARNIVWLVVSQRVPALSTCGNGHLLRPRVGLCRTTRLFSGHPVSTFTATPQNALHGYKVLRLAAGHRTGLCSSSRSTSTYTYEAEAEASIEEEDRYVPRTLEAYQRQRLQHPSHPKDARLLKVAILGEPNAGKSTLINALMGWRVCPVSKKVHTTRHKAAAVSTYDNTQIVFLDTPGVVNMEHCRKHGLEMSFLMDPKDCLKEADMIAVIVDVSNKWTRHRIGSDLLKMLKKFPEKDTVLILNKIDVVKSKRYLLDLIRILTKGVVDGVPVPAMTPKRQLGQLSLEKVMRNVEDQTAKPDTTDQSAEDEEKGFNGFKRVFIVSALNREGIQDIKEYFVCCSKPGPWLYHSSVVTDQDPQHLAIECVREKLLEHVWQEIPYNLGLKIEFWELDDGGLLRIIVSITCNKKGYAKMVLGPSGKRITAIARECQQELASMFRCDVLLKLIVKDECSEKDDKKKKPT